MQYLFYVGMEFMKHSKPVNLLQNSPYVKYFYFGTLVCIVVFFKHALHLLVLVLCSHGFLLSEQQKICYAML